MASGIRWLPGCLLLGFALLASMPAGTDVVQEQEKPSTEEKLFKEGSRKLFNELHCQKPAPVAVKAFLGCWRIAQSWSAPLQRDQSRFTGTRTARTAARNYGHGDG